MIRHFPFRMGLWLGCLSAAAISNAETKVGFRQVTSTFPVAVQRGTSAEVVLRSNFTLDETYAVFFARPGVKMTFLETEPIEAPRRSRRSAGIPFRFGVDVEADQLPGVYEYRVATKQAVSSVAQIMVTDYPVIIEEKRENGTPARSQAVEIPAAICGECERMEDVDCFQFVGRAGQQLTIQIYAQRVTDKIHGMVVQGPRIYLMDPILTLFGANGQIVAQNDNFFGGDSFMACRLPQDGSYTLEVRDARYAGDPRYTYCVEIGDKPYVHVPYPLAIQEGQQADLELIGHGLGDTPRATASASPSVGWQRLTVETPRGRTNPLKLRTSSHVQFLESEENDTLAQAEGVTLPLGINGRIGQPDDTDLYAFQAVQGQPYLFEVEAHRHGSPLDSVLELYNSDGKLLKEADDLTTHKTKDSRLLWTAPDNGRYIVALRDLHDRGGPEFVYHLRAELAEPDFELFGEYYYAMLAPGTRMMWFARLERMHGFKGPVAIEVMNLPVGVTATPVTIPEGMNHCGVILSAAEDAEIDASLVHIQGRATIDSRGQSQEIVRRGYVTCEQQSSGGGQSRWFIDTQVVAVTKTLDLNRVEAWPTEIAVSPGQPAEVQVRIERVPGFQDAVTLDTQFKYFATVLGDQLPPGVSVSSQSEARLAGDALEGKIILEATEKALPVERFPIGILARVSITFSITTNYSSNPLYLTVNPSTAASTPGELPLPSARAGGGP